MQADSYWKIILPSGVKAGCRAPFLAHDSSLINLHLFYGSAPKSPRQLRQQSAKQTWG